MRARVLPAGTGQGVSRRTFLRATGLGAVLAGTGGLSACGGLAEGTTRFLMNKPEVVDHFRSLANAFNDEVGGGVYFDSTPTSISAQFVRGTPPDIACYNYQYEASTYVRRDVLRDLGDQPEAEQIDENVQALVSEFADEERRFHVLPYSTAAAGVIYNQQLFEEHGVQVPTTWSEFIEACQTFQAADVTPIYATYRDTWTIQQGLFDYTTGGSIDVAAFFAQLREVGPDFEPGADYSFSVVMGEAVEKMVSLREYLNADAASRTYPDGNLAFGEGGAAMYFQGPWAMGEIAKIDDSLPIGSFALPMLDEPDSAKARVNLDLGVWIPRDSPNEEQALELLHFMFEPDRINSYNLDNLYFSPLKDAPPQTDERIAELQPYVDEGRFYQGPGTFMSPTIPLGNYLQEVMMGGDVRAFLDRLDQDWRRLALRSA